MQARKASKKFSTTFENSFMNKEMLQFKDYLAEYLNYYNDSYFRGLFRKLIQGEDLNEREVAQTKELMQKCSLAEMFVNKRLADEFGLEPDMGNDAALLEKLDYITNRAHIFETDWDKKFITDNGGILEQYRRKGYLSEKQMEQVDRLYRWVKQAERK